MSSKYKINPEIKSEILNKIKNSNASVSQLAKDYGISDKTIYRWLGKSTSIPSFREYQKLKRDNKALLALVGEMTLKLSEDKKKN